MPLQAEQERKVDLLLKAELESKLQNLDPGNESQTRSILQQLNSIENRERDRIEFKKAHIDSLTKTAKGFPVVGIVKDTLFLIYAKVGASSPQEGAVNINKKIKRLYDDDYFNRILCGLVRCKTFLKNLSIPTMLNRDLKQGCALEVFLQERICNIIIFIYL